jgi:hypothetical protein
MRKNKDKESDKVTLFALQGTQFVSRVASRFGSL